MGTGAQIPCYFDQAVRVGTVVGTNHQQQVSVGGNFLYCNLTILSGIADILGGRSFDIWEALAKRSDDVFGFIQAQGSLSEISDSIRIGHSQRVDLFW